MDQSQGGNPFGRLIEFARPHKTGYIVSVVLAVLGVAFGIVPYFATARMTIELLSGNRDLSFYMVWCLISGGCFVLKAILMGISTRASHEATFEVLSEARKIFACRVNFWTGRMHSADLPLFSGAAKKRRQNAPPGVE